MERGPQEFVQEGIRISFKKTLWGGRGPQGFVQEGTRRGFKKTPLGERFLQDRSRPWEFFQNRPPLATKLPGIWLCGDAFMCAFSPGFLTSMVQCFCFSLKFLRPDFFFAEKDIFRWGGIHLTAFASCPGKSFDTKV